MELTAAITINGPLFALGLFALFVAVWGWARFEFRLFRRVVHRDRRRDG